MAEIRWQMLQCWHNLAGLVDAVSGAAWHWDSHTGGCRHRHGWAAPCAETCKGLEEQISTYFRCSLYFLFQPAKVPVT